MLQWQHRKRKPESSTTRTSRHTVLDWSNDVVKTESRWEFSTIYITTFISDFTLSFRKKTNKQKNTERNQLGIFQPENVQSLSLCKVSRQASVNSKTHFEEVLYLHWKTNNLSRFSSCSTEKNKCGSMTLISFKTKRVIKFSVRRYAE